MSDEKFLDGVKLTSGAREAGELDALHGMEALVADLMRTIQSLIADIESRRERDD